MIIPKGTKVNVKAHHGGIAVGILEVDYESGGDVEFKESTTVIPAKVIKAIAIAEA